MFKVGTSLPGQHTRVFKLNSDTTIKDLGTISLNSGTLSTAPEANYLIYYAENSSAYYTHKEAYAAPCLDAVDDKVGVICQMDTTPTITEYNEDDNSMANGSTNCIPLGASEQVDIEVKIKVAADKCYGNPDSAKENVICFKYNTTAIESVETDTGSISMPYSISTAWTATTHDIDCYEFPKLEDTDKVYIPVTIVATSTEPADSNITIIIDDAAFDLDADTLEEIWDYVDEDRNRLGVAGPIEGAICYS